MLYELCKCYISSQTTDMSVKYLKVLEMIFSMGKSFTVYDCLKFQFIIKWDAKFYTVHIWLTSDKDKVI